jgi:hypothetical protein
MKGIIHFDLVTEYAAIRNGRDRQLYTEWRTDLEYDPGKTNDRKLWCEATTSKDLIN